MEPMTVRLRPFIEADLVMFDREAIDPQYAAPFEWFGFTSSEPLRRRWRDEGLLGASPYYLAVATTDTDERVGLVNWRATERAGPGVWEIGIVLDPQMRGRGAGTTAQRLLVDYLFSTTAAHRIWAGTEVDNIAEQRCLERCGFRQEGRLRGHHFRDGQWQDSFIYGITRPEARP